MTRVFVSSTYIDLKEHRKAVDEIINRLGAQFRGMEYFGARPYEPKIACFDEIEKCDIFVGIYAHRYGFVPKGDALSITEQEFDHAQVRRIPTYCYVVESGFPWNREFIEAQASKQIKTFKFKIDHLLHATFTTPDDLAKKVAADLRRGINQNTNISYADMQHQVNSYKIDEINSTIGKKYIRELYVARKLEKTLTKEITQFSELTKRTKSINSHLFDIYSLLKNADMSKLEEKQERETKKLVQEKPKELQKIRERRAKEQKKLDEMLVGLQKKPVRRARPQSTSKGITKLPVELEKRIQGVRSIIKLADSDESKIQTDINELKEELSRIKQTIYLANSDLNQFPSCREVAETAIEEDAIVYPATELNDSYDNLKRMCIEFQKHKVMELLGFNDNEKGIFQQKIDVVPDSIEGFQKAIKPVTLVIDRAGGGKTNLLCRLAEDLGKKYITFFLAAKSIINPDEDAIQKYFDSSYPLGENPIQAAINSAQESNKPVLVIIDGINECVDPIGFNVAIKAFVRRYYRSKIRFIISCRDIYWAYFRDTWWESHCSRVSENELYSFTHNEFRKALPLYLQAYDIMATLQGDARQQLCHPLLLRFFCEAFKGTPKAPSKIGRISNIRLLNLFDKYCERKFSQIAERLNLYSADEMFEFLKAIGRLMLTSNSRSLTVEEIGRLAKTEYNEESIRKIDSKYIQILDEDILLEQKPVGRQMNLFVSFVYEEFMEYTIARAIISDLHMNLGNIGSKEIGSEARKLLDNEGVFVSGIGVVFYLGCFLAREYPDEGLKFIDWLIKSRKEDIACRIISQWSPNYVQAFLRLINLHRNGDRGIKKISWDTMERMSLAYWDQYFAYISRLKLSGTFPAMVVYTEIFNACGGVTAKHRLDSINWIAKTMQKPHGDFKQGLKTIKKVIYESRDLFTARQMTDAEKKLKIVNLGSL